jgi:hypothetical protein
LECYSIKQQKKQSCYSPGCAFRLFLQPDGNAVVEGIQDATVPSKWLNGYPLRLDEVHWLEALWTTAPQGLGATELDMQADGNLVVYSPSGPLFSSQTNGNPGAFPYAKQWKSGDL